MNLLVFISDAFGGRGGIAKFNRDLLCALCSHVTTERVVAIPRKIDEDVGSLPRGLSFCERAAESKMRFIVESLRQMSGFPYDGVICGHVHLLPMALIAARVRRVPLILIAHGIEVWDPPTNRLAPRLVRHADCVVAVSDFTRRRLTAWSGTPLAKTSVIPNCIDLTLFGKAPKRTELLSQYGLTGKKVLLTVGRLAASERYKGIDEVLNVLPAVSVREPSVAYLIIGDGDDRPRLEREAERLGLRDRVVFAGYVPESDKADHYRLGDVFVMPGRGEGFGIVYLEALACGLPVIASALDASAEAVRGGELGAVVDPSDSEQLENAIVDSLNKPLADVPDGLKYFTVERFVDRWHDVLERTIPAATSRHGQTQLSGATPC